MEILEQYEISDSKKLIVGNDNDSFKKAYLKFMQKQMKHPRPSYLKKLLSEKKNDIKRNK